ncbi:MAG: hypothetical protein IJU37_09220 [Desulfovibrio sp.]|nr:hypothetical protein [Desulfovibrio sp.]
MANAASTLHCIDLEQWKVVERVLVPHYAVGLAVSPDGNMLVITSQGKNGHGGHVATVYAVQEKPRPSPTGSEAGSGQGKETGSEESPKSLFAPTLGQGEIKACGQVKAGPW